MRNLVKSKRSVIGLMIFALVVSFGVMAPVSMGAQPVLRVILDNHPYTDAIKPLIPEFEKATGIKVNLETYEETQLTSKLTVEFTSGASSIDVFMTRPLQEGRLFFKNNWFGPLNSFIDPKDTKYNYGDFPASSVQATTIDKQHYAIPLVVEWQVVFYRKDLFKAANLKPPTTLDQLEADAKVLNNPSAGVYGIVSRGQRNPCVTQFSSYLYNFGGDWIKDGRCAIDSPAAIKAFKFYGKLLHDYGPPGTINMSWPQAQAIFASGNAAMWTDASTLIAGLLTPDKSKVSDKLGVAVFPAGPSGQHPYMATSWALAMGSQSKDKQAAWKFIKWATSPEITKKAQLAGNTMARTSVWNDKQVLASIHPDLAMTAKKTGPIATPYDRPLMTAVVEARDAIGDVIVKSIETGGTADIEALAKEAAKTVNDLLDKAGELKK